MSIPTHVREYLAVTAPQTAWKRMLSSSLRGSGVIIAVAKFNGDGVVFLILVAVNTVIVTAWKHAFRHLTKIGMHRSGVAHVTTHKRIIFISRADRISPQ